MTTNQSFQLKLALYNVPLINNHNKNPIVKFDSIEEKNVFINSLKKYTIEDTTDFMNLDKTKTPYFFFVITDIITDLELTFNYYLLSENVTQLQEALIDDNTNTRDTFSHIIHNLYKPSIVFK
jgi:hypothetical protein